MQQIQCLQVSGAPMDNGIRDALYIVACKMIRKMKDRMKFTDEIAQGVITSEGKRRVVSSAMQGIEFLATIDTRKGTSLTCKFLVNDTCMLSEKDIMEGRMAWTISIATKDDDDEGEEWKKADG